MDGIAPQGDTFRAAGDHGELDDLPRFAREHHLSYEVEEETPAADGQDASAFEVRLFATHGDERLAGPTCRRCLELSASLRTFAERVVATLDASSWADLLEPAPVLYTASDQQGPDEISVVLRVLDEHAGVDGQSRVGSLEDRLKSLGAQRR